MLNNTSSGLIMAKQLESKWNSKVPIATKLASVEIEQLRLQNGVLEKQVAEMKLQIAELKKQITELDTFADTKISSYTPHCPNPTSRPSDKVTCSECLSMLGFECQRCCNYGPSGCGCTSPSFNNCYTKSSACLSCGHATPKGYNHKCNTCYTRYPMYWDKHGF